MKDVMSDLYYGVKKVDEREVGIQEAEERSAMDAVICPKCERGLKILENPELNSKDLE